MQIVKLKTADLAPNTGQVPGLPTNPRQWTSGDIDKIAASLRETPELFEARPVLVIPHGGKYVILGGNLRYEGARKNKEKEVPAIIFPEDTPPEKLREIVVKDNGSFGAWDYDALANEWDSLPLSDWGVPAWNTEGPLPGETAPAEKKNTELLSGLHYDPLYYEPKENPALRLSDCINDEKFKAKIAALDEYDLTTEQKETLARFAYRFLKIDFEAVANYYYFNATAEEKKAMERLRLVLVDDGSLSGFVEDGMLRVAELAIEAAKKDTEE